MSKQSKIEFFYNEVNPIDLNVRAVPKWIEKIIAQYQKKSGTINIIFCRDEYLMKMNQKFLSHEYYTDIISFMMSENPISGEIYISIDRVQDNARKFKVEPEKELLRVIIHGILHFVGFSDKKAKEKKAMREAENQALEFYQNEFIKQVHYFDLVYDLVSCIPYGKVCTYGAIADFLSLGSARMVGWALNQLKGNTSNVPAHRVVNHKGELTGRMMFGDAGNRMGKLLKKEGVSIKDNKVENFKDYFWSPGNLN